MELPEEYKAAPPVSSDGKGPHEKFAKKKTVRERGDRLYGNWDRFVSGACAIESNISYLIKSSIVEGPSDAGACDDGEGYVRVKHN